MDGCTSGSNLTVKWAAASNLGQPDKWWLYIGTLADPDKYINSGELDKELRELDVTGMPTNGEPVHMTLWWEKGDGNTWHSCVFSFDAAVLPSLNVSIKVRFEAKTYIFGPRCLALSIF